MNVFIVGKSVSQSPEEVIQILVDRIEKRLQKHKIQIGKHSLTFKNGLKLEEITKGMK